MNKPTEIVETARRVLHAYRDVQDGLDAATAILPAATFEDLNDAFAVAVRSGVRQVVPLTAENSNPQGIEHVSWREVARAGRACQRIYVLPHAGFGGEMLRIFLEADAACKLTSRAIVVSRVPFDDQAFILRGMWILDDDTVFLPSSDGTSGCASEYTVSSRPEDVRNARQSWERLWKFAESDDASKTGLDLEEPLASSADLLYGVAPVLCTGDHVDRTDCAWYHGTWQYLRLLQMVSTPTWHSDFYRKALHSILCHKSEPQIAITGTADYSMLAYAWAASAAANSPKIQVVDMCATPLFACQWFAKRNGFTVTTRQMDVRAFFAKEMDSFDVICTDAFLTRFSKTETTELLTGFRKVLKPGGKLVTSIRVHDRTLTARDPEQLIRDFRDRAIERARRWEPFLHRTPEEIGSLAEVYAARMKSCVLGDEDEVMSVIQSSGLVIEQHELAEVPGELLPTIYLRIVCQKPA